MTLRSPAPVATVAAIAVLVGVIVVGLVHVSSHDADSVTGTVAAPGTAVSLGLLAPTAEQLSALSGSAVSRVAVPLSWARIEPAPGYFDTAALRDAVTRVSDAQRAGLEVVLDFGLQYPPGWVFDLPGSTRFVNQYGDVWHGSLSQDVPNAVFNPSVRRAQARYLARLGATLGTADLAGVRIGGLLSGEVRYPPSRYAGRDDALWAFDDAALSASPDPTWRPGSGDEDSTRRVLTWYFANLTDYLGFLLDTVATDFPDVDQHVLLPSWGLRPGMLDQAVRTRFGPDTPTDVADIIASGLDWASQVALIATRPGTVVPYTTWLDAPDYGPSSRRESPISYLASLAGPRGLVLGGENTGGNGVAALARTLSQASRYHVRTVMFMSGGLITDGTAGLTLLDLTEAATRFVR